MPQPHEILQVSPDATKSEVEAAYRRLTMYADPGNAEYRATLDAARMAMLDDEPPKAAEPASVAAHRTGVEFSVGSVFSRTLSTLFGRPGTFFGITLVSWIPGTILRVLTRGGSSGVSFGVFIITVILNLIVYGAVSYAVLKVLRGESASIGESLSRSAARFGPLIGASVLTGLGTMVGMILLVVPGLILMCMWAVTTPACVVENLDSYQSLQRSAELTKGYRWRVLGLIVLISIATGIFSGTAAFVAALFFPRDQLLLILLTNIVLLFPQAVGCVMYPVIYYSLRSAKEGVSIDSLANVFD